MRRRRARGVGTLSADDLVRIAESVFGSAEADNDGETLRISVPALGFKERFMEFARRIDGTDIVCTAERDGALMRLHARRIAARPQRRLLSSPWVPRALFATVIAFVMIDGYVKALSTSTVAPLGDPLAVAALYTAALLGILGTHELGHMLASWHYRMRITWPYFIPGIPVYGIPTFGALIVSRSGMANRQVLFDVAVAGPVAGLAVTAGVMLYAAYAAPVVPDGAFELVDWQYGQPLLMHGALELFGKNAEGSTVILTPLMFAAWVGFFITFLNMLPAWQLDGGHMIRAVASAGVHKYATYASIALLVALGYYVMAMLVFVMSYRGAQLRPMDDASPLPPSRRAVYAAVAAAAILCAPLPSWVLA